MTGLLPPRRTIVLAAPLLALMACESATEPRAQGPVDLVASAEISLETQEVQGGFYFLPPMAKKPSYGGVFDAGVSPVVEVCANTDCNLPPHATFSMDTGSGSEVVRLEEEDERFVVNWHTGRTGAAAGQTYRVRVLVDDHVLGHADVAVVSTGKEAVTARSDGSVALVAGQTLPVAFRIETGTEPITYLSIVAHAPEADAMAIDIDASISVAFSAALDGSSLTATTISLLAGSEEIALTGYALSEGDALVTAQPVNALDHGTTYTVTIKGGSLGVRGDDGSTIAADSAWSFTTEEAAGATYTVVVSPALATVAVDGTQQFTAVVKDAGDDVVADPDVTWTTDDPAVATLDAAGLASGVAKGEATITADFEGVQAQAVLTVRALPVVVITSPAPDAVFEVGSSISFSGSATDSEGNDLTGSALVWTSDLDGEIGTGESVVSDALSTGVHTITLTATDGQGLIGTGSRTITVDETVDPGLLSLETIAAGVRHTCGIAASGAAYCWGRGGSLGRNSLDDSAVPVAVWGGHTFTRITAGGVEGPKGSTCGVTSSGAAYCWGYNSRGMLGDGTTDDRLVPVEVLGNHTFSQVSVGGSHTCGVTTSGAAYCWGENFGGRLGNGDTSGTMQTSPSAVVGDHTFKAVSAGSSHSCGITTSGASYCWGMNTNGTLGDGTTTNRFVPVAAAVGKEFVDIWAGSGMSCGLTASGGAFCWGYNEDGRLGDGSLISSTDPVAVAGGHAFVLLDLGNWGHSCGVTTSGEAYCWGKGGQGQLGDGNASDSAVPVLVTGDHTFRTVSASQGSAPHTCAIDASGAGYCWGGGRTGQLGNDQWAADSDIPVAVSGGLTFK
jgi:alpha-tubulin suppressor-like RCC1 family protein